MTDLQTPVDEFELPDETQESSGWTFRLMESALVSVGVLGIGGLALFDLPLYFSVNLIALPCLVLAIGAGVRAHRLQDTVAVNRLLVGVAVGLPATLAYDVVRLAIWKVGLISFDPFLSHPIFGSLILDRPVSAMSSIIVGWTYHFWNGFSFAVIYTLIAGRSPWWYAMIWAIALEVGWLLALPGALDFSLSRQLIAVSMIGHVAYGAVLGPAAQKWVKA